MEAVDAMVRLREVLVAAGYGPSSIIGYDDALDKVELLVRDRKEAVGTIREQVYAVLASSGLESILGIHPVDTTAVLNSAKLLVESYQQRNLRIKMLVDGEAHLAKVLESSGASFTYAPIGREGLSRAVKELVQQFQERGAALVTAQACCASMDAAMAEAQAKTRLLKVVNNDLDAAENDLEAMQAKNIELHKQLERSQVQTFEARKNLMEMTEQALMVVYQMGRDSRE